MIDRSESRSTARLRIQIELDDTEPPVWRLVEVPSTLGLDGLHEVIQVAFGWEDAHLHRFTTVADDGRRQDYLGPFEVADGADGDPEEQVRVDEPLARVGARLDYLYDYGDGWHHVLEVVGVVTDAGQPCRVTCLDGARPGPPEDCGGPHGYELIVAAQDPDHPAHEDAMAEFRAVYGAEVDPSESRVVPFDVDAVNAELAGLDPRSPFAVEQLDGPIAAFLRGVHQPLVRRRLRGLLAEAGLGTAAPADPETAARMVAPYRWLVDRVGTDGIALTGAGYLPPVHVSAAMDELGLADEWIGKGNREDLTWPVLHLRASARQLGLVRVARKRVLATAAGRRLVDDPVGLWLHLAQRMPMGTSDDAGYAAGMVALVMVAAGSTDGRDAFVAQMLSSRWSEGDGRPIRPLTALQIARDNVTVLRRLGALTSGPVGGDRDRPTAEGRGFARMALVTDRPS